MTTVTAHEAASLRGVQTNTIHKWVEKGKLHPVGETTKPTGHVLHLFDEEEVLAVAARPSGRRRHAAGKLSNTTGRLTPEGLVPLDHLWYESERVVAWVCSETRLKAVNPMGKNEPSVMGTLTAMGEDGLVKRWYLATNGGQPYLRLDVVDNLLCALGLHLSCLGEPDVQSAMPPTHAQRLGFTLAPPIERLEEAA